MRTLIIFRKQTLRHIFLLGSLFSACIQNAPKSSTDLTQIPIPIVELGNTDRFVKLEVTLKNPTYPNFYFTDLAFDKTKGFLFMKDDGIVTDYTIVYKILNGGEVHGKSYPGFSFDDGTGKKISFKYSFAINPNDEHLTSNNATSWDQMMEMISNGHSFMNHTMFHGGNDKLKAIKDGEKNMWKHTRYRMTELVPPGNDEGFVETGLQLGYSMMSSEFGEPMPDGNNDPGNMNMSWGAYIPTTTQNFEKVLVSRANLGDKWDETELLNAKKFVDYIFSHKDLGKKPIGTAFSHGPFSDDKNSAEKFNEFLIYIRDHPSNNETTWVTSSKELMDYVKTKHKVIVRTKNYEKSSRKYTVELDMENVDANVIYRNMSLKIIGGEIVDATVTGAEVTFNRETGLINLYKTDRSKVLDPFEDSLPPQITSIMAIRNEILITYDKPVVQTLTKGYEVTGNDITKIEGSGKNWKIKMRDNVNSSQLFSYRMQHGDAKSATDQSSKVCSYIGMPISTL